MGSDSSEARARSLPADLCSSFAARASRPTPCRSRSEALRGRVARP